MTGLSAKSTARLFGGNSGDSAEIGGEAESDDWLLHAYSRDASHFLMVPKDVQVPESIPDVVTLFHQALDHRQCITFRSGGSSLSGQSVTKEVLVDTRKHFNRAKVLDDGRRIRVEPGVTIRFANALLKPYGYRLGPDPASEIACTLGGALANNSSGMTCGTEFNSYKTLESMVVVLPSGTTVDTAASDANDHLKATEPTIFEGLLALRDRVRGNPHSVSEIQRLFAIKNTMGYSVNAFIDFDSPIDILAHLMIGSEGTLGFMASAVLRTVPTSAFTATSVAIFPSLVAASEGMPQLALAGSKAVELMDARAIRVARQGLNTTDLLPQVETGSETMLLIEHAGNSDEELLSNIAEVEAVVARTGLTTSFSVAPNTDAEQRLWRARKGLYALVAGARPRGTSALLEDVAVPMNRLAATCSGLSQLLDEFQYDESVIFGHARDGNLHFLLNEDFGTAAGLDRYARFTDRMVDLVLENRGTLKAEHGTGRVMAPYLDRQYGSELSAVMVEVKRLIDPQGLLNPDVIISEDPAIHLKDLKTTPHVEEVVDRCVDCGFCEPVCPSRNFTTTPRQRIALRRASAQAHEKGDSRLIEALDESSPLRVVDSCAVDGMCGTVCPLGINTGTLVEQLREGSSSKVEQSLGKVGAGHWGVSVALAGVGVSVSRRIPRTVQGVTSTIRKWTSSSKIPLVSGQLPRGGRRRKPLKAVTPDIIYLPSCMNTLFSPPDGYVGISSAFLALCREAGVTVRVPAGIDDLCCGTPWKSKGLDEGYRRMRASIHDTVIRETDSGRIPVVVDATSCTEGYLKALDGMELPDDGSIEVLDVVSFTLHELIPRLPHVQAKFSSVSLHPTCSIVRLGLESELQTLASHVAESTVIPPSWGCCAFAGDRGLLVPGLTQSATESQAREVQGARTAIHASCNRTCEIGMSRATGETYGHIVAYLARALDIEIENYEQGVRA